MLSARDNERPEDRERGGYLLHSDWWAGAGTRISRLGVHV